MESFIIYPPNLTALFALSLRAEMLLFAISSGQFLVDLNKVTFNILGYRHQGVGPFGTV